MITHEELQARLFMAENKVTELNDQRDKMLAAFEKIKADLKIDDPAGHYDLVCETIASVKGGAA